jgi:hypothetical protein
MTDESVTPKPAGAASENSEDPRLLLDQLVECAEQPNAEASEALELLARLAHAMAERFDDEENEGVHEEMLSRAPWLCATVRHLQEQHEELLKSLEGLAFTLRSKHGPHSPHETRDRILELVESYWDHEAAEGNLLQDSCDEPSWAQE